MPERAVNIDKIGDYSIIFVTLASLKNYTAREKEGG